MDEKHSQDGSLSGSATGNGADMSAPANTAIPGPTPTATSSIVTTPSFARAFPPPAQTGTQPPSAGKFELTSLIKSLPEPARTSPSKSPQSDAPQLHAPAFIPAAVQPVAPAVPIPVAPSFTPFVAPSARPAPYSPAASPPPAAQPATPAPSLLKRVTHYASATARFAAIAFAAWLVTVLVLIAAYRFINPPQSMLMLTQRLSGQALQHEWTPLEQISTNLRRAVITSEDGKFCRHWGFDFGEIRAAMRSTDGFGRGASTITQQLSKNLFLWNGKSYIRKGLEVPLTLAIETLWTKKRILEVYLNIAEWGPGVFGAQAAAQYYYDKPASQLSEREAALLAVSLPNPIARDASDPNPAIARRASTLQARMRVQGISYCALTPKKI